MDTKLIKTAPGVYTTRDGRWRVEKKEWCLPVSVSWRVFDRDVLADEMDTLADAREAVEILTQEGN